MIRHYARVSVFFSSVWISMPNPVSDIHPKSILQHPFAFDVTALMDWWRHQSSHGQDETCHPSVHSLLDSFAKAWGHTLTGVLSLSVCVRWSWHRSTAGTVHYHGFQLVAASEKLKELGLTPFAAVTTEICQRSDHGLQRNEGVIRMDS